VIEAPEGSVFKAGDTVFWRTDAWLTGAAREVTVVPEKYLAHTPKSLSLDIAAATPLSSLTAWQGIFEHGTIDPAAVDGDAAAKEHNAKQRIMITGAAGAVGSWALEFARAAGVGHIIAVCSGAKAEKAKKYGATEVIDYRTSSVPTWAQTNPPVDLIFDCVGGGTIAGLWSAVKDGGVFLSVCANPADTQPASKVVMTAKWFLVEPRGSDLGRIVALIDARSFEPQIDSVVPFEQFAEAWAKVDAGKTNGKVVVKVA
jgi:NADPH:quinone reductase-like Zn-dependent oxidoreductase